MFITIHDAGNVPAILANWPENDIKVSDLHSFIMIDPLDYLMIGCHVSFTFVSHVSPSRCILSLSPSLSLSHTFEEYFPLPFFHSLFCTISLTKLSSPSLIPIIFVS